MEEEEKLVAGVRNNRSYKELQKEKKKDKEERLSGVRLLEAQICFEKRLCNVLFSVNRPNSNKTSNRNVFLNKTFPKNHIA